MVPVGLTKFRDGLYPLEPLTKEDMEDALARIERFQQIFFERYGVHFIHASDEFYLMCGRSLPEAERYDGYLQLENGVGMLRLLEDEVMEALEEDREARSAEEEPAEDKRERSVSRATGCLAAPFIKELASRVQKEYPGLKVTVYAIQNRYFGELITVSGLITGQDLVSQLQGKELGERLLLPVNMFKSGEEVFLDDVTLAEVQSALQIKTDIVKSSGREFVNALTGAGLSGGPDRYRPYELKE